MMISTIILISSISIVSFAVVHHIESQCFPWGIPVAELTLLKFSLVNLPSLYQRAQIEDVHLRMTRQAQIDGQDYVFERASR